MLEAKKIGIGVAVYYPTWKQTKDSANVADTTQVRGTLGHQFLDAATMAGYQVTAIDGGSSPAWQKQVPSQVNLKILEKPNMGVQKRGRVLETAKLPVDVIVNSEAEKVDIVKNIPALCQPILDGQADVVVGNRRDTEFATSYPDYGYVSEKRANQFYNGLLKSVGLLAREGYLDIFSGFIAFANNPKLIEIFSRRFEYVGQHARLVNRNRLRLDGWSNCQMFPLIQALQQDFRVQPVEIPFVYAPEQKANEEHPNNLQVFKDKRRIQLTGIITEAVLLLRNEGELKLMADNDGKH